MHACLGGCLVEGPPADSGYAAAVVTCLRHAVLDRLIEGGT